MSSSAPTMPSPTHAAPHTEADDSRRRFWRSDTVVCSVIAALVGLAWWITEQGWFTSWSRTGYWLGVAGGVAMLLLFTYPLRKRWKVTYTWGATKHWFAIHMVLGVMGPWLILLHSTFSVRSTNAAVALYAMIAVALSGVVGRFLFTRLNTDLRGEQASLASLRQRPLQALPQVQELLHAFEDRALGRRGQALPSHFARLVTLPWQRRRVEQQCKVLLQAALKQQAEAQRWPKPQAMAHYRELRAATLRYTATVQRAAQFQTFERLFSL